MNADELVAAYILDQYRDEHRLPVWKGAGYDNHLASCDQAEVVHPEARDGSYGCDTGCECVRFEATIRCPHGESVDYEYGEFGELSYILEDLAKRDRP